MHSLEIFSMFLGAAFLAGCDASTLGRLGSGSYTNNLLDNRLYSRPGLGYVAGAHLDACRGLCPIGTTCTLHLGVHRCVTTNGISVVDTGYGNTNFGLDTGVGLTSNIGSIGLGNKLGYVSKGYNNFGVSVCGMMAPECLATRRDLFPVYKYTFDRHLNRCVKVGVCLTCANFNSVRHNLFNSFLQCTKFCH